jgi:hypothetical protein
MPLVVARRTQAPQIVQVEPQVRVSAHWLDVIHPAFAFAAQ